MIPTFYYFLGFLLYTGFNMITFNSFSKIEDEMKKKAGLFIIYLYYSILASYVISFVDIDATGVEIAFQTIVYIVAEGIFLWFNYKEMLVGDIEYR